MREPFKDREHLIRMAGLFAIGITGFLIARSFLVPSGFGEIGHYRAGAPAEARAKPIAHAGRAACAACHEDQAKEKAAGRHARLGCESCHGPLARHAEEPSSQAPVKPDGAGACLGCHAALVARPAAFPQVGGDHGDGEVCTTCHMPHSPAIDGGGQ